MLIGNASQEPVFYQFFFANCYNIAKIAYFFSGITVE